MFKISDNLHFSFLNYTNFKCSYFFANETTFAILGTHFWPLSDMAATDFVKLMCHAREVFPGREFLSGASIVEKLGLEIFWGNCLKIMRFSDRYFLYNYLPRGIYLHAFK